MFKWSYGKNRDTASHGGPKCFQRSQSLTFLGPTNLAQLGCPLPESLRVGSAAVAVDLRVSGVVLARRAGLPRRPAGRDELRDA